MVWSEISLGSHTGLHVFHWGTPTGVRYSDEIFDLYVGPYDDTIGSDFIPMDVMHYFTNLWMLDLVLQFVAHWITSSICRPESEKISLKICF